MDELMVIDTGSVNTIRATKALKTRAGNELGVPVRHWHVGTEVYARPEPYGHGPGRKGESRRSPRLNNVLSCRPTVVRSSPRSFDGVV